MKKRAKLENRGSITYSDSRPEVLETSGQKYPHNRRWLTEAILRLKQRNVKGSKTAGVE